MNVALKFHIHGVHTQPMRMDRNRRCTCINICNPRHTTAHTHTERCSPHCSKCLTAHYGVGAVLIYSLLNGSVTEIQHEAKGDKAKWHQFNFNLLSLYQVSPGTCFKPKSFEIIFTYIFFNKQTKKLFLAKDVRKNEKPQRAAYNAQEYRVQLLPIWILFSFYIFIPIHMRSWLMTLTV